MSTARDDNPRMPPSGQSDDSAARPATRLTAFARNVTSQCGEDGIIEKVLEVIGETDRWCVEFGSWDGRKCSNTFSLIDQKGYSAVLIEADRKRFKDLLATFGENGRVISINACVGFSADDNLDGILSRTDISTNFDVLSIDIDGNDYHVWNALTRYKPKVVVVEFNPTIPPCVEFVQPADARLCQGSSLLSLAKLGRTKGYELVCATTTNAVFVDARYFPLFGIEDNSVEMMMTDLSSITYIFCGYDGTVFLRGNGTLPWQGIRYKEARVQQLPWWARKVVNDRSILRRKARKLYLRLRHRKSG